MTDKDRLEFYNGPSLVASVRSSIVPPVGAKISVNKETWTVVRVTFALDYEADYQSSRMRANVDLKK